jgi:hypothetical protein
MEFFWINFRPELRFTLPPEKYLRYVCVEGRDEERGGERRKEEGGGRVTSVIRRGGGGWQTEGGGRREGWKKY